MPVNFLYMTVYICDYMNNQAISIMSTEQCAAKFYQVLNW